MNFGVRVVTIVAMFGAFGCGPDEPAPTTPAPVTHATRVEHPESDPAASAASTDEAVRMSQQEQDNARKETEFRAAQAKQKAHSDAVIAWQQQATTDCPHAMTYDTCKATTLQDNAAPTDDEIALCRSVCGDAIDGVLGHRRLDILHRCTANKPHKCDFGITSSDLDVVARIKRSTDGCQRDCSERVNRGVPH
jgi:hypothetical protein